MSDTVYSGKVHIKVVRADDLRTHLNRKPAPMAMLRVSVAGSAQQDLMKTDPMPNSTSPEWNQEFVLPVSDASQSQLECTIWDTSDPQPTEFSNFLGEVLLNLAKLIPYKGHYIEQVFFVKQGKTIKTEQQATGNLKLGLRLDIAEQPRSPGAGVREEAAAAEDAAAKAAQDAAAKAAREAKDEAERRAREEQERRAREAEAAAERAAQQAAEARRAAEAERARSPSPERASPDRSMNRSSALDTTTVGGTRTRIVIAVIEASNLPHGVDGECNPMAVVRVQGPATSSAQQTKAGAKTHDPFWNEKFVFGVEESHVSSSAITAEVVSGQEVVGTIAPVAVKSLLHGQKMSLPTINNGADIYCIDGWFEVHPGRGAPTGGVASYSSPTKIAGKAQLHLRMTFIPAAGVPPDAVGQGTPSPSKADHSINNSSVGPRVLHHQLQRLPGGPADIGVLLRGDAVPAGVQIEGLVPSGPAANSRQVQPGDVIIDIDGTDVAGKSPAEVQQMLRGEPHSPVTLIYQRAIGADPLVITLLRAYMPDSAPPPPPPPAASSSPARAPSPPPPPPQANVTYASQNQPVSIANRMSEAPVSDDAIAVLRHEFQTMAFLWGEPQRDPGVAALNEWKDELLYGNIAPTPATPGIHERSLRSSLRESMDPSREIVA